MVTLTEEILNGKLHFLCSADYTNLNPAEENRDEFNNVVVDSSFYRNMTGFKVGQKAIESVRQNVKRLLQPIEEEEGGFSRRKTYKRCYLHPNSSIHCTKNEVF